MWNEENVNNSLQMIFQLKRKKEMCQKAELKEIVYREMEGTAGSPKVRGFVLEKNRTLEQRKSVFIAPDGEWGMSWCPREPQISHGHENC